eukprot:gene21625-27664_t
MDDDMTKSLIDYFIAKHDEKDLNKELRYSPTTLRSWLSIFAAFYLHSGRGDLKMLCPIIEVHINNWQKGYKKRKARAFKKDELVQLHNLPDSELTLLWKAYSAIGCAFAGRGCEIHTLTYDSLVRNVSATGEVTFFVYYERSKASGVLDFDGQYAIIKGEHEVRAIEKYLTCFTNAKDGRFFRKLHLDKTAPLGISVTQQNIGHNKAGELGKLIAAALGLKDPNRYTGHCWRNTTLTWAANAGLTVPMMKSISDHKSDAVCQDYIQSSEYMKNITSSAVALKATSSNNTSSSSALGPRLFGTNNTEEEESQERAMAIERGRKKIKSCGGIVINVSLNGATINAPFNIMSGRQQGGEGEDEVV